MHQVENLTVLYRGRGFWHTPELNQAIAKIIDHFGDRASIPPEFIAEFMSGIKRHGLPSGEGWNVWYESCPVVKTTAMEVVVTSQDMPPEIMELYPDFYKGGKFHINKAKLQRDGRAYHSRHGEYFYIAVPDSAKASNLARGNEETTIKTQKSCRFSRTISVNGSGMEETLWSELP